jgi:hypothetical protein
MRASSSSARKARRSKGREKDGEQQERPVPETPPARSEQAAQDRRREAAVERAPLVEEPLCPGDRRRPGRTLAAASTLEPALGLRGHNNKEAAAKVGAEIAARAKAAGVEEVYFDRGGFLFHGKVKALADAAREGGLKF